MLSPSSRSGRTSPSASSAASSPSASSTTSTSVSERKPIRVAVRIRPPTNAIEKEVFWSVADNMIAEEGAKVGNKFDMVFGKESTNEDIWQTACENLVDGCLNGFNGTIFAYGQTASGKTHTMSGTDTDMGIIRRAINHIFNRINQNTESEFLLRASYLEVYNENTFDLLTDDKKIQKLREDKGEFVFIPDVTKEVVRTPEELESLRRKGDKNRAVGVSNMNIHSSRSHSLFRIHIETCRKAVDGQPGRSVIKYSTLNMVDLAGSETYQAGVTSSVRETSNINKSLLSLQRVIDVLSATKGSHVPYRDSELTKILKTSLGGNSCTTVVCTINPIESCRKETHGTLLFGGKARNVELLVTANEDSTEESMLAQCRNEISVLQQKLTDFEKMEADRNQLASQYEIMQKEMAKVIEAMKEQHAIELEIADKRATIVGSTIDEAQAIELENEIGNLSDLIGGLQLELSRAQEEKKKLHVELANSALDREAAEKALDNWRQKLKEAENSNFEIVEQLKVEKEMAAAAMHAVSETQSNLSNLESERDSLMVSLQEQQALKEEAVRAADEAKMRAESLEATREKLVQQLTEQMCVRECIEIAAKENRERAEALEKEKETLEGSLSIESQKRQQAEEEAKQAEMKVVSLMEEYRVLQLTLGSAQMQREALEQDLQVQKKSVSAIAKDLERAEDELVILEAEKRAQEKRVLELKEQQAAMAHSKAENERLLKEQQSLLMVAKEEQEEWMKEQQQVRCAAEMQLGEVEQELQRLRALERQYEEALVALEEEKMELHRAHPGNADGVARNRREMEEMRQLLERREREIVALKEECESMRKRQREFELQMRAQDEIETALRNQIASLLQRR